MGYTFDTKVKIPSTANSTTNANPATGTISIADDADLLILAMIYGGNAARTGGSPTANGVALTQADTARTVTEAVAELWYLTTPQTGINVIVVPNTPTAKTLDIFVATFKAQSGYGSAFNSASGSATTAANPSVSVIVPTIQSVVVSVCGDGVNAWGPTSQSGTVIFNDDPSTWGGGAQYILNPPVGAVVSEFQAASDDYGIIAAAFIEQLTLKSVADTGLSSDDVTASNTTPIAKSASDTAQGIDQLTQLQASLSEVDTSFGIDNISQMLNSLSVVETGQSTENLSLSASISISDNGLSVETISIIQQIFRTIADIGSALDSEIIQAVSFVTDSITGQDDLIIQAQFVLPDTIVGIDNLQTAVGLSISEILFGDDLLDLSASLSLDDLGLGSETINLITGLIKTISDAGLANDQITISISVPVSIDLIEITITNFRKPTIDIELVQPMVKFSLNTQ